MKLLNAVPQNGGKISLDTIRLTRYTEGMVKSDATDKNGEALVLLGVKIPREVLEEILRIKDKEQRTKSQVGGLLLQRGLGLYQEDGLLIEPEEDARKKRR